MEFVTDNLGMTVESIKPRGGRPEPSGLIFYDVSNPNDDPGEATLHFASLGVSQAHYDFAVKNFPFRGLGVDPDTDEPVSKWSRIGVLDTDHVAGVRGWTAERKAEVERIVLANPDHGTLYKMFEPEPATPPWPTYDDMRGGGRGHTTAQAIAEFAVAGGYKLEDVVAFERQGRNREDVIAALEAKLAATDETEKISVTV